MTNPLMSYAIPNQVYVSLSADKFYPEGVLDANADTSEMGVKPMSARDEYAFNNPSALMNGKAVIEVIANCVPEVLQPQNLHVNDIEILLLGVYLASGHKTYDVNVTCPKCKKDGVIPRDIDQCLRSAVKIADDCVHTLESGVIIHVRPNTWANTTHIARIAFEQQKISMNVQQGLMEHLTEDEKVQMFMESYNSMVELNFKIVLNGISRIELPDETMVTDEAHIKEFIETLSKDDITALKEKTEQLGLLGIDNVMEVLCPHCEHEWNEKGQRFDPSYFFG